MPTDNCVFFYHKATTHPFITILDHPFNYAHVTYGLQAPSPSLDNGHTKLRALNFPRRHIKLPFRGLSETGTRRKSRQQIEDRQLRRGTLSFSPWWSLSEFTAMGLPLTSAMLGLGGGKTKERESRASVSYTRWRASTKSHSRSNALPCGKYWKTFLFLYS